MSAEAKLTPWDEIPDDVPGLSNVYALPYPAVDALVAAALRDLTLPTGDGGNIKLKVKWVQESAGSSRHYATAPKVPFGIEVVVRALPRADRMLTSIIVGGGPMEPHTRKSNLGAVLNKITALLQTDEINIPVVAPPPQEDVLNTGKVQRRRGAGEDPINREAREALARGEERKTVFRKWATKKKYSLSNPDDSERAESAFRQMVSRKPKPRDVT